jgi:hypothetical protein
MINNVLRIGNFTSSEIVALMSMDRSHKNPGKPYYTYIEECNMERRLGRSVDDDVTARPLSWGILLEKRVHELLGPEYSLISHKTFPHPDISCWAGSPDFEHHFEESIYDAVGDAKCPSTLKSFCQLVQPLYDGLTGIAAIQKVRETHKDGDKFFYQLTSNASILDRKYAELIAYMPYKSELDAIREMASNYDGADQFKFKWIADSNDDQLPHLPDGGYYKNLNVIRFIVPTAEKTALMNRVVMASNELVPFHQPKLIAA